MKNQLSLTALLLICSSAHATTYNFHFNTNEQGDGGTITNVQSVAPTEDLPNAASAPERLLHEQKAQADVDAPSASVATPAVAQAVTFSENNRKKWSVSFGASNLSFTNHFWAEFVPETNFDSDSEFQDEVVIGELLSHSASYSGPRLSALYRPLDYLGFGFGASLNQAGDGYLGLFEAEIELAPVKLSLFGFQDAVELFAVGGGNFLTEFNSFGVYYGAGTRLNFGGRWSIEAAARQTFMGPWEESSSQLDSSLGPLTALSAGLSYKF